ncbi:MAG TPA: DUF1573 domain-containing protein [Candidatus Sphingobacterium stercorigallinarum]|nr:DUF1573 domain-containing protein [Candidatus Sphingobacterium stercorigallinarum]
MKNITTICVAVLAFIGLTSMALLAPEFKFDKETHDFGKIAFNKPVSHEYQFTNSGDQPIIISDVQPTCGCSVAEFTKTPVKPGESGTVNVTFNAATKGPFTKSFIVKSNTKTPVKTLTIKGVVE